VSILVLRWHCYIEMRTLQIACATCAAIQCNHCLGTVETAAGLMATNSRATVHSTSDTYEHYFKTVNDVTVIVTVW
jgi:hypothetical protein